MEGDPGRILAALREPACYPHAVDRVELLETHISWVFLAGDYAYKVKKPVSFAFLDFSTLAKRRFYCDEELRLNRRTAPALYLEVLPVADTPQGLRVGGDGAPVEYALRMRRFPQEALADAVARRGELSARHVDALAAVIAEFHSGIPPAREADYGSPQRVAATALASFEQIAKLAAADGVLLADLRAWTGGENERLAGVFSARRRQGFVRECHGDLHLGNIVLLDGGPVPFDCIEFDPALRWIDVTNEIAFLVMDLLEHGLAAAAWRLLNAYLEATGDYAGVRVLRYYLVYRAMVRALVACIREHQPGSAAAQGRAHREFGTYLALARSLSRAGQPALLVMHGVSGSGKTVVSQKLLEQLGAVRVRSDIERKRLHGLAAGARTHAEVRGGIYAPESTRLTYDRLAQAARDVLASGYHAIVDATFLALDERDAFRALARDAGAGFLIVACEAAEDVLRERVAKREAAASDASEAGVAVLERQLATREPLAADEVGCAVRVDTGVASAIDEAVARIAAGV